MRKAPSFQFYPADYLTDFRLAGFTLAQHGAYFLLLSYDWLNDGLPVCKKSLSKLLRTAISEEIEDVLELFGPHQTKPNTITSSRLQAERENQKLYKEAQSANGKASAAKRSQVKFESVSKLDTVIEHQQEYQTHDRGQQETQAGKRADVQREGTATELRSTFTAHERVAPTSAVIPSATLAQSVVGHATRSTHGQTAPVPANSKIAATEQDAGRSTNLPAVNNFMLRGQIERELAALGIPLNKIQIMIATAIERGEPLETLLPSPQPQPVEVAKPVEATPAKKTKAKKEIAIPKYQGPDRAGNPRQLVDGFENIWLSEPELAEIKNKFDELGLTKDQRKLAVEKVDTWLSENPVKLAKSSEHKSRILDWGVKAVLELATAEIRSKRAQEIAKAPIGIETKGEREQRKARELIAKLKQEEDLKDANRRSSNIVGAGQGRLA